MVSSNPEQNDALRQKLSDLYGQVQDLKAQGAQEPPQEAQKDQEAQEPPRGVQESPQEAQEDPRQVAEDLAKKILFLVDGEMMDVARALILEKLRSEDYNAWLEKTVRHLVAQVLATFVYKEVARSLKVTFEGLDPKSDPNT